MIARDPFSIAAALLDPPEPEWRSRAHPGQLPPPGNWRIWYVRGGRGGGKTWTGANVMADWIREAPPGSEFGIVAPTFGAARRVNVEGKRSGLLTALGLPGHYDGWNRSDYQLTMPNGTKVFIDGADRGARNINGLNLTGLWADEVGLWMNAEYAWDESIIHAIRMDQARVIVTGTPKRAHPLIKRFLIGADPERGLGPEADVFSVLPTSGNIANLSKQAIDDLYARYGGTSLGAQELEGELLDEAEGAMWTMSEEVALTQGKGLIRRANMPTQVIRVGGQDFRIPHLLRTVLAIDPAVSTNAGSSETGMVIAVLAADDNIYVRGDLSGKYSPDEWAQIAVQAYDDFGVDRIVVEVNQGGDLLKRNLDGVRRNLPITTIHVKQGKQLRAEPVQGAYQRGKVFHVPRAGLDLLELQMVGWEPNTTDESPDRIDALVHAITELDSANSGKVEQGQSPWN